MSYQEKKHLVCLLEERSAEEMLKAIFSQLLSEDIEVKYIVFEGKSDLEKNVERKLKGWQLPNSVFLIMRDKDGGNCLQIKKQLNEKVCASGQQTKTVIRIACSELESFYLGDLKAVEQGLKLKKIADKQQEKKYRNPDLLTNAAEELSSLTQKQYQKIAGSRAIAPFLKLDGSNCSYSFNILIAGVEKLKKILLSD